MEIKQVGIIGAGVTGLVTAKTFLEEGYQVTVFEKQKGLGGVWEKSRTYPELATQTPGNIYSFSEILPAATNGGTYQGLLKILRSALWCFR